MRASSAMSVYGGQNGGTEMAVTIFERCGGFATVRKVVSSFYDKLLDSESLSGYFENADMRRLIDHQTKFIASIMGGPAEYSDEVIERVHQPLNITKPHFLEMADLLRETLEDFEVEDGDIQHVYRDILRREGLVVGRQL